MHKKRKQIESLSISQNYLTSSKTISRLLRLTSISKNDHVIEIGAGKGHITKALVKRCKKVTAIEVDKQLFERLKVNFNNTINIRLMNIDFLKMKLPQYESYKVFSNIPFSITTDIMGKLFDTQTPISEAWLIMEKGAAKRFSGKPKESQKSLLLKPFYDFNIIYYFRKEDFHPKPSVDIVLLHIKQKELPDLLLDERKVYNNFILNSYKYGLYSMLSKKQVSTALRFCNLPQIESSGTILYVQWLCLFRFWLGRK